MIIREKLQDLSLSILAAIIAAIVLAFPVDTAAQGVAIDGTSATSQNLKVVWTAGDPEKIVGVYWNPNGLTGSEPNLTFSHSTADPCADGLLQYFGNSWAPPDPQSGGKVLVGAGSNGVRMKGPDSKVIINSTSTGCAPSAGVGVTTLYKFWQGGMAQNKMRATRTFSFEEPFNYNFRPFIPRLYSISDFSQVIFPNATGTALVYRAVGGNTCGFGCEVTDWNGNNEETAWFAIHDPVGGRGLVVKRNPSSSTATLWLDWDGGSNTTASSVLLKKPVGGFTGEVVETETMCFYDATTWLPSLTLPPGC